MAFDLVVRAFFTDSGLSAGLAKANEGLKNLGKSGPGARQGVRSVEAGVRSLAFQSVGLPGPLGRIAQGFLLLGGGNALMLGAVAGLVVVGAAIRALTRDARDNAAAQQAMLAQLERLGPHGAATAARIRIAELERKRDDPTFLEGAASLARQFGSSLIGGAGSTPAGQREAIERQITEQKNILARALAETETPANRALRESAESSGAARLRQQLLQREVSTGQLTSELDLSEALERQRLEYEKLPPAIARKVAAQNRESAQLNLTNTLTIDSWRAGREATIVNDMLGASQEDVTAALRRYELELKGLDPAMAAIIARSEQWAASSLKTAQVLRTQLPAAFAQMGTAALQGMDAVAQSAIQSLASIAQALPGVTPLQQGLIGFAANIIGGLFNRREPLPVNVTNAADFRPEGPDRFTLQIFSPTTGELLDEIEYELGRRSRLDRVVRIPRGVAVRR